MPVVFIGSTKTRMRNPNEYFIPYWIGASGPTFHDFSVLGPFENSKLRHIEL